MISFDRISWNHKLNYIIIIIMWNASIEHTSKIWFLSALKLLQFRLYFNWFSKLLRLLLTTINRTQPNPAINFCRFQTDNGIKQEEVGYLKAGPDGSPITVIQGSSSYVAPDGRSIDTGYVADENGYRPYGAHLPTPPPIPVEIQESLRLLATLPSTPEPHYQ